jgi:hypothetical protein
MRALCVIAASDNESQQPRLTKALDTFYSQHWEHAVATHKPEVMKETLVGLFGEEEAEKSESACFFPFPLSCFDRCAVCPGVDPARHVPFRSACLRGCRIRLDDVRPQHFPRHDGSVITSGLNITAQQPTQPNSTLVLSNPASNSILTFRRRRGVPTPTYLSHPPKTKQTFSIYLPFGLIPIHLPPLRPHPHPHPSHPKTLPSLPSPP